MRHVLEALAHHWHLSPAQYWHLRLLSALSLLPLLAVAYLLLARKRRGY